MSFPRLIVLRRELTVLARRRAVFVIRALWLGAIVGIFWLVQANLSIHRGLLVSELLARFFTVGMLLIGLLVPPLVIQVIASELDRDTLALLLLTHLSPAAILLQKLASRLWFVLLLMLAPLPMLVALAASHTVTAQQVGGGLTAFGGALAGAAAAGLVTSTCIRSAWRRWLIAYLLTAVWLWGWVIIDVSLGWFELGHPLMGIEEILHASLKLDWWAYPGVVGWRYHVAMLGGALLALVLSFGLAARRLQHLAGGAEARRTSRLGTLLDLLARGRRHLFPPPPYPTSPLAIPAYYLERRRHVFGSMRLFLAGTALIAALGGALATWRLTHNLEPAPMLYGSYALWQFEGGLALSYDTMLKALLHLVGFWTVLGALLIGANAFAADHRHGQLALLVATPTHSGYLVVGKYWACLMAMLSATCLAVLALYTTYAAWVGPEHGWGLVFRHLRAESMGYLPRLLVAGATILAVALSASARRDKPLHAISEALLYLFAWAVVFLAVVWAIGYFGRPPATTPAQIPATGIARVLGDIHRALPRALAGKALIVGCLVVTVLHLSLVCRRIDPIGTSGPRST